MKTRARQAKKCGKAGGKKQGLKDEPRGADADRQRRVAAWLAALIADAHRRCA